MNDKELLDKLTSTEILGLTIIGEARGEPIEGQVAIGSVVRNRLQSNIAKYTNLKNVCLESKQFSCWNENDPNYIFIMNIAQKIVKKEPVNDPYIRQCMLVAEGIENWSILDNTKGKLYYLEMKRFLQKRPDWARNAKPNYLKFGNHIFFNI